jgi:two-component sensor histidine kinase
MNLTDPLSKLSAGPVHFAYTGWAFVDILPESNPTPDDNYYLKFHHPYSFEADSWINKGEVSKYPICSMNAGYSSGWCEESYGIELTAVEISCKAKGDENCTFIMAPPNKIEDYLSEEEKKGLERHAFDVPLFFERKKVEETIKKSLLEKVTLLQEIHHRVKNNLQIVSSFLSLQSSLSEHSVVKSELRDSRDRIKAMALLHETLYAAKNIGKIDPAQYFNSVVRSLSKSYRSRNQEIETSIHVDEEISDVDMDFAIPCGLIINELVSNSYKYAFPDLKGSINISLTKRGENGVELVVKDNGIGLPAGLNLEDLESLGLQIVYMLTEQMDGSVEIKNDNGTEFKIDLKSVNFS